MSGSRDWDKRQGWNRKAVELFKGLGPSEEWPHISGTAAKTLGVNPTPPSKPDPHVPEVYPDFLSRTLDFAISSHRSRHPLAVASATDGESKAWKRIYGQVSEGVRDPERFRKDPVGAVRIISAQLSYRMGDCRLPLYVGPKVANKLFELRAIAAERRVRTNQWRMDSQRTECPENWQVVTGNSDRARRRLVWEHAKAKAWGSGQIRDEAGSVAQDASDDELIPPASE